MSFSFAIGCFHFSYHADPPFTLKWSDYVAALTDTLNGLPTIGKVDVNHWIERDDEWIVSSIPGSISDGHPSFPPLTGASIGFDIHIPERIQRELDPLPGRRRALFTEDFRVELRYGFYGPATFVVPVNPTQRPSPSDAVVVVREFLSHHFSTAAVGGRIKFESLGPSPFHADFYLDADDSSVAPVIDWSRQEESGYDTFTFRFSAKDIEPGEAITDVLRELSEEAALFYYIISMRVHHMWSWAGVEEKIDQLVGLLSAEGPRGFFRRVRQMSRHVTGASIALAQFEGTSLRNHSSARQLVSKQPAYHVFKRTLSESLRSWVGSP